MSETDFGRPDLSKYQPVPSCPDHCRHEAEQQRFRPQLRTSPNPSETHPMHPSAIRMGSRPPRPIAMRNSGVGAPRLRSLYEWSESMRLTPFPVVGVWRA